MNSERRVQRVRQCIPVIGDSKPDWAIICELAAVMGFQRHFNFQSPEAIWEEVQAVWKAGAGISYPRIEHSGLQWPCLSTEDPGTTMLHTKSFPVGERAAFSLVEYRPTAEQVSPEFPYLLSTGRTLTQFNAGTMTARTPNLILRPTDYLEMCAEDARQEGLVDGQCVTMTSRYGSATLPVRITEGAKKGEVFSTFHDPTVFVNRVTSNFRDGVVGAPEYKVTAVRLEAATDRQS